MNPSGPIVKIDDFRTSAEAKISKPIFDYIDCGACDGITSAANAHDFDNIRLLPLCLRDVSRLDLATSVLGQSFKLPIGFSPTAFHKLVDASGEVATATAAKALQVPMVVSSMCSIALEHICARSGNDDLWFQTYIFKDRTITRSLIERAVRAGYKAIVVTIGSPVVGKRDRNILNRFSLPTNVSAANFKKTGRIVHNNPIYSFGAADLDPSLTWADVRRLCSESPLPVVLKGILNPVDAALALKLDICGLIVSNHGGRQLDTTESTIRILPEIARVVANRIPVLFDGGIRRGTDVLKALALGADAVLLGRPVLWALAVGGQKGVEQAVNLLADELRVAMQIIGCCSMDQLRKNATHILRSRSNGFPAAP